MNIEPYENDSFIIIYDLCSLGRERVLEYLQPTRKEEAIISIILNHKNFNSS